MISNVQSGGVHGYKRPAADTGRAFEKGKDNEVGYDPSPVTSGEPDNTKTDWCAKYFTSTGWGFQLIINVLLHVGALITAVATAVYFTSTDTHKTDDHDFSPDFDNWDVVKGWALTAGILQPVVTIFTLAFYGFVDKGLKYSVVYTILLSLQLMATASLLKLSYWIAMAPAATRGHNKDHAEYVPGWIYFALYFSIFTLGSYIATPISGVYSKMA